MRDGGYKRIDNIFEVLDRFPTEEACRSYLSEFCRRFSRRTFTDEIFDRLLRSCIQAEPLTLRAIVAA